MGSPNSYLLCLFEAWNLDVPAHTCNPSTLETEAGGLLWVLGLHGWIPDQSWLHYFTLSWKTENNNKILKFQVWVLTWNWLFPPWQTLFLRLAGCQQGEYQEFHACWGKGGKGLGWKWCRSRELHSFLAFLFFPPQVPSVLLDLRLSFSALWSHRNMPEKETTI